METVSVGELTRDVQSKIHASVANIGEYRPDRFS
jgi:hypothetical protein